MEEGDIEDEESEISEINKSLKSIHMIKAADINEIRACKNLHPKLATVLTGCYFILEDQLKKSGIKAIYKSGQNKKELAYEEMAKKYLLGGSNFLKMMATFDIGTVTNKTIEMLHELIFSKDELSVETMRKVSSAGASLYMWVKGVYDLHRYQQKICPKGKSIEETTFTKKR